MTARSTLMVRSADPTIRSHLEACRRISVTVMAGRRHSSAGQRSESRKPIHKAGAYFALFRNVMADILDGFPCGAPGVEHQPLPK